MARYLYCVNRVYQISGVALPLADAVGIQIIKGERGKFELVNLGWRKIDARNRFVFNIRLKEFQSDFDVDASFR